MGESITRPSCFFPHYISVPGFHDENAYRKAGCIRHLSEAKVPDILLSAMLSAFVN